MPALKTGDKFPDGVVFKLAPWTTEDVTVPGLPEDYDASAQWKGKKVCLISVPGAFTPTCQNKHIPPFVEKLPQLKDKGVDVVAVIAFNDAFVMSAWGKVNGVKNDDILFMADTESKFAEKFGWMAAPGAERNARFAMLIDRDGTIIYAEPEKSTKEVSVSSVDAVMAKL